MKGVSVEQLLSPCLNFYMMPDLWHLVNDAQCMVPIKECQDAFKPQSSFYPTWYKSHGTCCFFWSTSSQSVLSGTAGPERPLQQTLETSPGVYTLMQTSAPIKLRQTKPGIIQQYAVTILSHFVCLQVLQQRAGALFGQASVLQQILMMMSK